MPAGSGATAPKGTRSRLGAGAIGALIAGAGLAAAACAEPALGDLPARCSEDGRCPEGYDCIHGVCAEPGTHVPVTIARLEFLRGVDLRIVPQETTALVTWQTYAYSEAGEAFVGARIAADGSASAPMDLVASFEADEGAVEPFYDVLAADADRLLLAVSAAPLPDDDSKDPRLVTYRVELPPEGNEARGAKFAPAWPEERRMETVGYGAVSRPRLLATDGGVDLGYVQSRREGDGKGASTIAELAIFPLDAHGKPRGDPVLVPVRQGLTVAVGVVDAAAAGDAAWWILDDRRPSAVRVRSGGDPPVEAHLERLGVPVAATSDALLYIEPSERAGEKLPTDPVAGPARLRRVTIAADGGSGGEGGGGGPTAPSLDDDALGEMPELRDSPRPVWIGRSGGERPLLVTPGADIAAPVLAVYAVDPETGATERVASVERFSTSPIAAVAATLVRGKLFVAWADAGPGATAIRAAVIPAP